MLKFVPNYARTSIPSLDYVITDVTMWLQNRCSIYFYKWKKNVTKSNKDIIIKLRVPKYHVIVSMPIWNRIDYVIDDVTRS